MVASKIVTDSATSPAQIRAARALLDWSLDRLALESGVAKRSLIRMESGGTKSRVGTMGTVRAALEAAGVQFIEENGGGAGVRLRAKG